MKKEPKADRSRTKRREREKTQPPPFNPDPRLITQLEGGRRAASGHRFHFPWKKGE